ncbi:hypothetical protein [Labilibaculum filiforme]|nr:hypothetical protein [Labilibaculum filiforme]
MKNIKILFLFSALAMLFACEADYEPLNDYSDVDWYTSTFGDAKLVGVDNYLSFSDLSQNYIDHSWSFADTSGCKFLKGVIVRQDTSFTQFIDKDLDEVSTKETVSILFTKPGVQGIRLRNTFPHPVTFEGLDTLVAVKEGDVWVIDTTFMVDVYDTIQSAFKVFKEDIEIANVDFNQQVTLADSASWPTVEIEAGASLKFVDMTEKGRPNLITWSVNGGSPSTSTDSAAVVNYYRLGTFFARQTAARSGENLPFGNKMKYVPLKIKVIKSSLPFEIVGTITEKSDETIQMSVSGELVEFTDKEEFFTVHVTNPNGFDKIVPVSSVSRNASFGNIIDLKLSEAIYGNDVVTVSYAGGNLESLDERTLQGFTDILVTPHVVTLTSESVYGFESGADDWISTNAPTVAYSTEQVASGNYSIKLTSVAGEDWTRCTSENNPVELEAGKTYTIKYKVWIDPSTTTASMGPWFYWNDGAGGQQFWTGLNPLARGEWISFSRDQVVPDAGPGFFSFRVNGDAILYFDDVTIIETDNRP